MGAIEILIIVVIVGFGLTRLAVTLGRYFRAHAARKHAPVFWCPHCNATLAHPVPSNCAVCGNQLWH